MSVYKVTNFNIMTYQRKTFQPGTQQGLSWPMQSWKHFKPRSLPQPSLSHSLHWDISMPQTILKINAATTQHISVPPSPQEIWFPWHEATFTCCLVAHPPCTTPTLARPKHIQCANSGRVVKINSLGAAGM